MTGSGRLLPELGRTVAVARSVGRRLPEAFGRAFRACGHKLRTLPLSGLGATSAWTPLILVALSVSHIGTQGAGVAMADIQLAMGKAPPVNEVQLGAPDLSPDGNLAVMDVLYPGESLPWLVVFDLESDEVRRIDKPANEAWMSPSFSSSGERIVFIRYCARECVRKRRGFQISLLDLETGRARTVTEGDKLFRGSPIFSPDDRWIVYSAGRIGWIDNGAQPEGIGFSTLRMLDLETGNDLKILSDVIGSEKFFAVYPVGFLDADALVFTGMWPKGPVFHELAWLTQEKDDKDQAKYSFFGYKMRLGLDKAPRRTMEFISPEAPKRIGPVSSLTVSYDTGRMAYVGRSDHDLEKPGYWGFDVFVGDGETFRQGTSLSTHMAHTAISRSGNRVAFMADDTRRKHWSLWILDIETGQVWETSLRRQLLEHRVRRRSRRRYGGGGAGVLREDTFRRRRTRHRGALRQHVLGDRDRADGPLPETDRVPVHGGNYVAYF